MLSDIERSFIRVRAFLEQNVHAQTDQSSEKVLKIKIFLEKNVEK